MGNHHLLSIKKRLDTKGSRRSQWGRESSSKALSKRPVTYMFCVQASRSLRVKIAGMSHLSEPVHMQRYKINRPSIIALIVCGVNLLFGQNAVSQTTSGTISGVISDPNGAVLPRAAVTITQTQRNVTQTGVTNDQGSFRFLQLPPGTYNLSVKAPGFRTYQQTTLFSRELGVST